MNSVNPDKQTYYLSNSDKAMTCSMPSLRLLDITYGEGTASAWLMAQIYNVSEYCGCKDKMTTAQIAGVSRDIAAYYKGLKTSEILLFFGWFKMGRYGHFYGAVDPMVLTSALYKFNEERKASMQRIEAEENTRKAMEASKEPTMTYEEYKRLKLRNNG